jgi:hypothetical protein
MLLSLMELNDEAIRAAAAITFCTHNYSYSINVTPGAGGSSTEPLSIIVRSETEFAETLARVKQLRADVHLSEEDEQAARRVFSSSLPNQPR